MRALAKSLEQFAYAKGSICIQKDTNLILAGHAIRDSLLKSGYKEADVIELDFDDAKSLTFLTVDNQFPLLAEWDDDLLQKNIDELKKWEIDLESFGFEIEKEEKEETFDVDAAMAAEGEPVSKIGDVWLCGKHRVMCGDSTKKEDVERNMKGTKADFITFDPPYGIGLDEWDNAIDIPSFICLLIEYLKDNTFFAFFIQMPPMVDWLLAMITSGLKYKEHIIWVKRTITSPTQDLLRGHESILIYKFGQADYVETKGYYSDIKVSGLMFDTITIDSIKRHIADLEYYIKHGKSRIKKGSMRRNKAYNMLGTSHEAISEKENFTNVWSFLPESQKTHDMNLSPETIPAHPTMKPILLMERLVCLCSKGGALVLDPFLGSGTTLIACKKTGRICYGMEISPHYVDVICRRYYDFTGDVPILEATGEKFLND